MRQCTPVTDRRTDGPASWHKREMYILHLALKIKRRRGAVAYLHTLCGGVSAESEWVDVDGDERHQRRSDDERRRRRRRRHTGHDVTSSPSICRPSTSPLLRGTARVRHSAPGRTRTPASGRTGRGSGLHPVHCKIIRIFPPDILWQLFHILTDCFSICLYP